MLPDRVSNPGPLTYESGALPIALRGPAVKSQAIHPSLINFIDLYQCSHMTLSHWFSKEFLRVSDGLTGINKG